MLHEKPDRSHCNQIPNIAPLELVDLLGFCSSKVAWPGIGSVELEVFSPPPARIVDFFSCTTKWLETVLFDLPRKSEKYGIARLFAPNWVVYHQFPLLNCLITSATRAPIFRQIHLPSSDLMGQKSGFYKFSCLDSVYI